MTSTLPEEARRQIAAALDLHAMLLGLSGRRAADVAGISEATWRRISSGTPVAPASIARAIRGLVADPTEAAQLLELARISPSAWSAPAPLDAVRTHLRTARTELARAAEALERLAVER